MPIINCNSPSKIINKNIITRFAPSPTSVSGGLHIGGLRTALYNFLFAKQNNGKFFLRIEDTDESRSNKESLYQMLEDMLWAGLDWNCGPSKDIRSDVYTKQVPEGSENFQSRRKSYYDKYFTRLYDNGYIYSKGGAYYFDMRKHTGDKTDIQFKDLILGTITLPYVAKDNDNFVIMKSRGMPTFYFASVVDDIEFGTTHIIRGQEHIPTTFKQIKILEALNITPPLYAHIPLMMNETGSKMSKRQSTGQINVIDFVKDGYLKESILNYIALCGCGFHKKDEDCLLPMEELIKRFDLKNVSKSAAKFDYKKLENINKKWLSRLNNEELLGRINEWAGLNRQPKLESSDKILYIINVCKCRSENLEVIYKHISYLLKDKVSLSKEITEEKKKSDKELERISGELSKINEWSANNILSVMKDLAKGNKEKMLNNCQLVRKITTNETITPPIEETLFIIGKEKVLERLK